MTDTSEKNYQDEPPAKGRYPAYVVCWLLGIGCLFSWNSMLTVEDYYVTIFPHYHPARVLTLVYQPFALTTIFILTFYEARINTRLRIIFGYTLFFVCVLIIPLLDLASSGHGGIGVFIGICLLSGGFGVADAHVQGGMIGDLSFMQPEFVQSFSAGLAASGVITSCLRLVTKASFSSERKGLRKGALTFFFISAAFMLLCLGLYALVFPRLELVKYYRKKAASEGSKTVNADLAAGGIIVHENSNDMETNKALTRLSNKELLHQNLDYAIDLLLIYVLTLSIFPGFLAEDTGHHQLGTWYVVVLIAMFNCGDLIGRYIPLIKFLKLESRMGIMVFCFLRFGLIPAFYFTSKYGNEGWMLTLCVVLGLTNGYLTVCVFISAPNGYKGPEQNALGNILVLFLLSGIFAGVTLDWLWLIGKGW